ncbi:MAG: hypothetical protein ACYC91_03310 [Solirubrobacteraceae bacterium]
MSEPEQALPRARAGASEMRDRGGYSENVERSGTAQAPAITTARLLEWAVIDPDVRIVRSNRRYGAPMTAIKRLLVRLLMQYHTELLAQQIRFNLNVVGRLRQLEQRIEQLEVELELGRGGSGGEGGDPGPAGESRE